VRFTQKRDTLYAILLDRPAGSEVRISGVTAAPGSPVHVLGCDLNLEWAQNGEGLRVRLPSVLPEQAAYALRFLPTITR
jgi:hypothetical protein